MTKIRLDQLIIKKKLTKSLKEAQFLIISGNILVNNEKITKPGHQIPENATIRILKDFALYVSRGGEKLFGAYKNFNFPIKDKVALDVGISTGGFTDFLIQNKADFVFGIDVGYGQLANKIMIEPKVFVLDRTNARNLTKEIFLKKLKNNQDLLAKAAKINLVVMDLSFISILKVLPAIKNLVAENTDYIVLIKPQFEAEKEEVGPKGIISDDIVHQNILARVEQKLTDLSFTVKNKCISPILGTKGNKEFFFWLVKSVAKIDF
ncbi:MAG: TlyA family RNA methyltransferase [Candidatus Margulisiibacteriota bacterium]|jgi:23S rRNA (cytidine1920-2'-O)/16S rRNA (cytidine1409-2'-O)-methyltransferase